MFGADRDGSNLLLDRSMHCNADCSVTRPEILKLIIDKSNPLDNEFPACSL
jgi:hypothetical protein